MKIRVCESLVIPYDYAFPSESRAGNVVHHAVPPTLMHDAFCSCEGFNYRGSCKHVDFVNEFRCTWIDRREDQKEVFNKPIEECPKCGRKVVDYELEPEI